MGKQPGEERGCLGERGQSSVIGVVLILGIVITSLAVIATVGGLALLDTEDELSVARAEKVMTQFDSQSALVALGETDARQTRLASGNSGGYTLDEDAGWMRVSIRNTATGNVDNVTNSSLGSLTYETDGVRLAYQGGGVWQKGDGDAVMVSPPEFHYRGQTLTLPIINVTGDGQVSRQVTVQQGGVSQEYPDKPENESFVNPVPEQREVVVTVKSDYYRGWGSYFERRTEGNVSYDNANQTAEISLTVPITEEFNNAVTATSENVDAGMVNGTIEDGVDRPPADGFVTDEINSCESGGCNSTASMDGTYTSDTYYSSGDMTVDDVTLDTSGGDISIVANGTVTFDDAVDITGDGNVTVYAKGMATGTGSPEINTGGDIEDLLVYLHSDATEFELNGNPQYTGLIYAPDTKLNINGGGGSTNIVGSIVVEEATRSGNSQAAVVDGVPDIERTLPLTGGTTITYLHISETNVQINDS